MWIRGTVDHMPGKVYLLPFGVRLAPKNGAPRLIQLVQRTVPVLQPFPEGDMVRFGIEHIHMAVEFVVDLPADDSRMILISLHHSADDCLAQLPVLRAAVVGMPP
ncbi:hypothetical protein D3C75_816270 [compost metagenome]